MADGESAYNANKDKNAVCAIGYPLTQLEKSSQ